MPLVKPTLQSELMEAFKAAMNDFIDNSKSTKNKESADTAISKASQTFGEKASAAIDKYIKSATIVVPPGQLVATAGSPAAQTGATTNISPPAKIS